MCSAPVVEYPCAQCGYAPEPEEYAGGGTEVVHAKLAKFARMIAQGPAQRWETLLRWLGAAKLKGHRPGSVRHKWRAVYGEDVDSSTFAKACREVGL